MLKHIHELHKQLASANDVARQYDKAIKALQDICVHDMKFDCHGHKETYYTCSKCGKKETDR